MKCFVISPFGGDFDLLYQQVLAPVLKSEGFEASRADTTGNQGSILHDIVNELYFADLIVADLTDLNANVMYELGLAHALKKPTLLLTQSIASLPFDLKAYKVYEYQIHFAEIEKLRSYLSDIAHRFKEGRIVFGSPVTDFLSSGGNERPNVGKLSVPDEVSLVSDETELGGFFDKLLATHGANQDLFSSMIRISLALDRMSNEVASHTERLLELQITDLPDHLKLAETITISKAVASEVALFSDSVMREHNELMEAWRYLQDFGEFVTQNYEALGFTDEQVISQYASYITLEYVSQSSLEAITQLQTILEGVGLMSKDLRTAVRNESKSVSKLLSFLSQINASSKRFSETFLQAAIAHNLEVPDRDVLRELVLANINGTAEGDQADSPTSTQDSRTPPQPKKKRKRNKKSAQQPEGTDPSE